MRIESITRAFKSLTAAPVTPISTERRAVRPRLEGDRYEPNRPLRAVISNNGSSFDPLPWE